MFKRNQHIYIDKDLDKNLDFFEKELGAEESFDVIIRPFKIADRKAAFIAIDGFVKDDILTEIMQSLSIIEYESEFWQEDFENKIEDFIPYIEMDKENKIDQLLLMVLSGSIVFLLDGMAQAFVIDARTYPARSPEEPDIERVVRGSRDGFTETIVFNTALVRRRVRDPKLRNRLINVGRRSKTDICISYLEDVANPELVKEIISRIEEIEIDAVPMAEKSLEEIIVPGNIWNPFPKVRYTERPDVAAAHLFEGHILVMVDTSPSVMILPATFFHHIQHVEEYRQNPAIGVYVRLIRFLAIIASIIVTPLWLLFALSPELLPDALSFIGPKKVGEIPLFVQFLIGEAALDLMRMAAIHTPSPLATALGVIAAILIGDVAVQIGLLIPEVIIYTAVVAVGSFSTPSYELAQANRLVRLFLLLGVGFFKLPGLLITGGLVLLILIVTKSFNVPYLWPLIPFNYRALKSILIRSPVLTQDVRPEALKTRDIRRQPGPALKRGGKK
ncbi:spore germination protein [Thermosyntropha sp.]|uniref:spore germination protein n=1 Tax=Thermosyntropha sp. TaxID=2740820 RepID=UPI0025CEF38A|nr:spore germination protein [Thermosyntropha sp.]MBO8158684.1 spore germination protein [Thermosyntropha sp.]